MKALIDTGTTGLGELYERLRNGVYATALANRPADLRYRDQETLGKWPDNAFHLLRDIREEPWDPGGGPDATIRELTARMHERRPLLTLVLFSPDLVLGRLLESCGDSGEGLVDTWLAMCWTAEAAWRAVAETPGEGAGHSGGDAVMLLLIPLAARLRFLVLSEPMRGRELREDSWWRVETDQDFGGSGILDRAFGPESWRVLVGHCQQARRVWVGCLDAYQSHPLLSQAQPDELERELATLLFVRDRPRRSRLPLRLSVRELAEHAPLTAEDKAVISDATDRHLLPRFALASVAHLGLYHDDQWWRRVQCLIAAVVVLSGLAVAGCSIFLDVYPATWVAAGCYALLGAGSVLLPGGWSAMWLLRMPAASAVGIITLVGFLPGDWLRVPPAGWAATLALALASFGYLVIEARNHGVDVVPSLYRALLVEFIGAMHALMVGLIGLVAVAPAFVPSGPRLQKLWSHPSYGHTGMVLALATAWCLAVGVFSQILWDDKPITAALAHLSWRAR